MLSSGLFSGVCSLNANVSEHSVCSIFIGEWERSVTAVENVGSWMWKGLDRKIAWVPGYVSSQTFSRIIPHTAKGSGYFSSQAFSCIILHILNRSQTSYLLTYEDVRECCETLAFKLQTPGNNPEESIRYNHNINKAVILYLPMYIFYYFNILNILILGIVHSRLLLLFNCIWHSLWMAPRYRNV
jgi:hypothetical protein